MNTLMQSLRWPVRELEALRSLTHNRLETFLVTLWAVSFGACWATLSSLLVSWWIQHISSHGDPGAWCLHAEWLLVPLATHGGCSQGILRSGRVLRGQVAGGENLWDLVTQVVGMLAVGGIAVACAGWVVAAEWSAWLQVSWVAEKRWFMEPVAFGIGVLSLPAVFVGWVTVAALFRAASFRNRLSNSPVLRGRKFASMEEIRANLAERVKADETLAASATWVFGGQLVPAPLLQPHSCFVGSPGSGKSMSIAMLLRSAVVQQGRLNARVVSHDRKRDQYALFRSMGAAADDLIIVDPTNGRGRGWDVAADITSSIGARQLASLLCPVDASSNTPYFSQAAQDLLTEVVCNFVDLCPGKWSLLDVVLAATSRDRLCEVLRRSARGKEVLKAHLEANADTTSGNILSSLQAKVGRFREVAELWSTQPLFSVHEWLNGPPKVLLLGLDDRYLTALSPVFAALFSKVAEELMALPERHQLGPSWVVLDEVRLLPRIERLVEFTALCRSKQAHVVVGFQDLGGLREVYGESAEELIALCGNLAVFQLGNPKTAEHFGRLFGDFEHEEPRVSNSQSKSDAPGNYATTHTSQFSSERKTTPSVLQGELNSLKPASKEHGIEAAYLSPQLGMWKGGTTPQFITEHLPAPMDEQAFVARAKQPAITDWSLEDRVRLGLIQPPRRNLRGLTDELR